MASARGKARRKAKAATEAEKKVRKRCEGCLKDRMTVHSMTVGTHQATPTYLQAPRAPRTAKPPLPNSRDGPGAVYADTCMW